jgi:hypothetical protein
MKPEKPEPTPELTTHEMLPVHVFVVCGQAPPPGTPARPRVDRPALGDSGNTGTLFPENGHLPSKADQPNSGD